MGIKADKDDWIVGFTTSQRDNRLIFAMMVDERQYFDNYFRDKRFQRKKPVIAGTWRQRCGDNIYYLENDQWGQIASPYHYSKKDLRKDTRHPYMFISKHFYYFGEKAPAIPERFKEILWNRQGCKYDHDPDVGEGFIGWLADTFQPGKHGEPMDRDVDDLDAKCSA